MDSIYQHSSYYRFVMGRASISRVLWLRLTRISNLLECVRLNWQMDAERFAISTGNGLPYGAIVHSGFALMPSEQRSIVGSSKSPGQSYYTAVKVPPSRQRVTLRHSSSWLSISFEQPNWEQYSHHHSLYPFSAHSQRERIPGPELSAIAAFIMDCHMLFVAQKLIVMRQNVSMFSVGYWVWHGNKKNLPASMSQNGIMLCRLWH